MEITKGKPCRIGCTITYNPKHELELDLWKSEKIHKEKLQARRGKKMARVKPYEKKCK